MEIDHRELSERHQPVSAKEPAVSRMPLTAAVILTLATFHPCPAQEAKPPALRVTSTAFKDGAAIPRTYTCDGKDRSPPLQWSGAPDGTKSFALICDDPDAPKKT